MPENVKSRQLCMRTFCVLVIVFLFNSAALSQSIGNDALSSLERMAILHKVIQAKRAERNALKVEIASAPGYSVAELNDQLTLLSEEVTELTRSFERMAIGPIDAELFESDDSRFNWRDEITLILQPMVENLKALTEKPRKMDQLRGVIERNELQLKGTQSAIASIKQKSSQVDSATADTLKSMLSKWERRRDRHRSNLEIATLQLNQLLHDDESVLQTARAALIKFVYGRGLTLVIAIIVGLLVWALMRALLWLFQLRPARAEQQQYRTRRRLAQYAYRALTLILILLAVVTVFYVRGDRLLLGVSILAMAAFALGLRHTIPRFLAETRLLLNIGATRENERIIYAGLPWRVVSLNMYSILRNPELTGVVRLPLSSLSNQVSRPAGKEPWFPTSKGDFILRNDAGVQEVMRQTAETVELKSRGGAITSVPSSVFYNWTFENLSRGGTFGIRSIFGVDYQLLDISLDEVPKKFARAVRSALSEAGFAEQTQAVTVDLASAGSSSLDYRVFVELHSDAADAYLKIERLMQQTCVDVCRKERWGIPFPHVTVQPYKAA